MSFIDHRDKRILLVDFSNCELEEVVKIVKQTKELVAQQPLKSLLTLTCCRGIQVSNLTTKVLKELADHDKPFVKAAAVVGLDSIRKIQFDTIVQFSGRNIASFNDLEEAKEWLIAQ